LSFANKLLLPYPKEGGKKQVISYMPTLLRIIGIS
jgi:hypothetical protein